MAQRFNVNSADLAFILKQIKIAEMHAGRDAPPISLTDAIQLIYGLSASDAALSPFGLRTVDGRDNNLLAGQSDFGAADTLFPRLLDPVFMNDTDGDSIDFDGPGPSPAFVNGNYGLPGNVIDADPRTISNLIVNQTVDNPAALDAWFANPLSVAQFEKDHPGMTAVRPGELSDPLTQLELTNRDIANIYNQSPDIGLSPGFNAWMTFFGQFFDHGLDLVTKADNGTVYIPLEADDPLIAGDDGIVGTADDLPEELRFMALTRAKVQLDANGIPQAENTTTPFIDQNQTYTSNPSHQVFLREYTRQDIGDGNGMVTRSTGHLLDGSSASGSLDGALANWGEVKANAVEMLGLTMDDFFVHSAPLLKTDQYGNFIAGENGYAQVAVTVVETVGGVQQSYNAFMEGVDGGLDLNNLAASFLPTLGGTILSVTVIPTNHQFLVDIAHHAAPGYADLDHNPMTPAVKQVADDDLLDANGDGVSNAADVALLGGRLTDANGDSVIDELDLADVNLDGVIDNADLVADDGNPLTYDDEMLGAHYITGDGRGNENIALTTVHTVFHSEHNRLVETYKETIIAAAAEGDIDFLNEWLIVDVTEIPADTSTLVWDGERLFQAGRFVTEMQYQHLVFEEFARGIQPNIDPFVFTNDAQIDPSIIAEFAHTVYRFGHSMLADTVDRLDNDLNVVGGSEQASLIDAFLNPQMFMASGADLGDVIGNVVRGAAYSLGSEIDEFVVPELQNNLLGLPLDLAALNIARSREQGIPSLNESRRQLYDDFGLADLKPYVSWLDFAQHIKNPSSIVNFIAAYGTHDAITSATTLTEKRDAALLLVLGDGNDADGVDIRGVNYTDRLDFLSARNAFAGGNLGGLNIVDLWIGGLAEEKNEFGGMLGSTFNFVFEYQLEHLQVGDRFYYLSRTQGTNLLNQLEPNTFTDLVMRNSSLGDDYATHLNGALFFTPDQIFELDRGIAQPDPDPTHDDPFLQSIDPKTVRDYSDATQVDVDGVTHDVGGRFSFSGGEHVVVGGTEGDDHITTDKGIDTLWGDGGNDYLNAGSESDNVFGGDGDDIIEDPFGDDVLRGDGGNDVISAGTGLDLIFGGEGNDYIIVGQDNKEAFGDAGDDFILGGTGSDNLLGGEGNDWIEGGDGFEVISGENSELFFNSPIIGHDVAWGQGNDTDYDLESGDDIAFTGPGIQRFEGMFGFDWAIGKYDDTTAKIDLAVPIFTNVATDILRDRYDQMEAASGWIHDDEISGDDRGRTLGSGAPDATPAALFADHILTQEGIDRIDGLSEWLDGARETLFGAGQTSFFNGNILMGGDGSDSLRGRGGNDLLDGDSWLNVRIKIDMGNGLFYTAESLTTDTRVAGPNAGRVLDETGAQMFGGRSLSSLMLDRTLNPGQLSIVREILYDQNPDDDTDTAIFQGTLAEYEIEGLVTDGVNNSGNIIQQAHDVDGDGWIKVRDMDDGAVGATIVGPDGQPLTLRSRSALTDDTDLVRNIERLQFADKTLVIVNKPPMGSPLLSDATPTEGEQLTVDMSSITDLDGLGPFSYQWQQSINGGLWTDIGGATDATFTPRDAPDLAYGAQAGMLLRVKVGYLDGGGTMESVFSAATGLTGVHLTGGVLDDVLIGFGGDDILDGGGGLDLVDYSGAPGPVVVNLTTGVATGDGTDQLISIERVSGSNANDILTGSGVDNVMLGRDGDDFMYGLAGNDIIRGNIGNDFVDGGAGNDTLYGGDGIDRLAGRGGNDVLYGGTGNDLIQGHGGNDTIYGEEGNDRIYGLKQNDLIVQIGATGGRDYIDGGQGSDTYKLLGSAGAEAFTIYTRDAWLAVAGNLASDLASGTEIVVTRNGSDNAHVISELDNIEEIVVDTLNVTPVGPGAPVGGGSGGGDNVNVVGDFTTTSLNFNTITVNSGMASDTVDISGLTSDHRLVFNGGGGADAVIGTLRPQDIVDFHVAVQASTQLPTAMDGFSSQLSAAMDALQSGFGLSGNDGAYHYPEQFLLHRQQMIQVDPFDLGTRFIGELSSDPAIREYQEGGMRYITPAGLEGGDSILDDDIHGLRFDPQFHELMDGAGHFIP